jgi:8-oxo-dGTP diphosphatase
MEPFMELSRREPLSRVRDSARDAGPKYPDVVAEGAIGAFAAVLDRQGRVLIVRERKPPFRFGFPGGRIEPGETAMAAVVRECREENGLDVAVSHLIGSYSFVNGLEAQVFSCVLVDTGDVKAENGSIAAWYEPGEVPRPLRGSFHHALPDVLAGRRDVTKTNLPLLSG